MSEYRERAIEAIVREFEAYMASGAWAGDPHEAIDRLIKLVEYETVILTGIFGVGKNIEDLLDAAQKAIDEQEADR